MPTALDRLLTSPSALRTLRAIVNTPKLSTTCLPAPTCCHSINPERVSCRAYSSNYENSNTEETGHTVANSQNKPAQSRTFRRVIVQNWEFDNVKGEPEKARDWAIALAHRERLYGLNGVSGIFKGMARRRFKLPTEESPDAEILWGTFLRYQELARPILDHAADVYNETGRLYPRLYELCMTHWLPRDPKHASYFHHHMVLKLRLRELPLKKLAQVVRTRFATETLDAFMKIYRTSNERNIYDEIVPVLCDRGEITLARRWHHMCIHRTDLPSAPIASHPVVQLFLAESSPDAKRLDIDQHVNPIKKSKYNRELMCRLTGRDTAPVRFEDPFCARLFATNAFLPASIIKGLTMVGVNEIGPQALRVMALRTDPLSELPDRFKELKGAGIALQGCVFSLALEKLAIEGKHHLVRSILESDQHPDVFGDAELQRRLLDFYLEQEDWMQAHRTLAILSMFHNESTAEAWNLLLRARIRQFNPPQLINVLQDMCAKGVNVSGDSMTAIRAILRHRQRGKKPVEATLNKVDDLRFVSRIYITIVKSGIGVVYPLAWRELIRRFGMLGRFRELKRLLFWLVNRYASRQRTPFVKLPEPPLLDKVASEAQYPLANQYEDANVIPKLFRPSLQQGLIIWGFRCGILPTAPLEQSLLTTPASKKHFRRRFLQRGVLRRMDWSIGLRTLVELRELGVHVHQHTVVKALQMQFVILFGRGRSNKRENRKMEDVNTIPYNIYVREVNQIWGCPLFQEPKLFGKSKLDRMKWRPMLPRLFRSRSWVRLDELLGSGWRSRTGVNGEKDESSHAPPAIDRDAPARISSSVDLTPISLPPTSGALEDDPEWAFREQAQSSEASVGPTHAGEEGKLCQTSKAQESDKLHGKTSLGMNELQQAFTEKAGKK